MFRRGFLAVAALLLVAAFAVPLHAQLLHREVTWTIADSLRRETCRGGTLSASGLSCKGATSVTRVTTIRRLANRLDSAEVAWVPDTVHALRVDTLLRTVTDTVIRLVTDTVTVVRVDTLFLPPNDSTPTKIVVGFDYLTTVSWPYGHIGTLVGTEPNLLCATVDVGGVPHLGDKAVVASFVSQDSIAFYPSTLASQATLRSACGRKLPLFPAATAPIWPVVWMSERVDIGAGGPRVAVPVAMGMKP